MNKPTAKFLIASGMPQATRFIWFAALAFTGIAIQVLVSVFVGWLLVLAAALMGLVRSVSNEPELVGRAEWANTTMEELEKTDLLLRKTQSWKAGGSAFSALSCTGCMVFALVAGGIAFAASALYNIVDAGMDISRMWLPLSHGGSVAALFALDAFTLVAPTWLVGRVAAWEPPQLSKRIAQLTYIYKSASSDPRLEWQPSLSVHKTENGSVPLDCKLTAKIKDTDKDFMGIQIQTTLNSVQGTTYPYTYCVLIAKPEFGLFEKAQRVIDMPPNGKWPTGWLSDENEKKEAIFPRFGASIVELNVENDVEIAVVRQSTKGTGYRTSDEQAMQVFSDAYQIAMGVLGA